MNINIVEEIAKKVQEFFRLTPLLLVGSGFSCSFGLPGMPDLANHLGKNISSRLTSADAQTLWLSALSAVRANLEEGLGTIANGAAGRQELVDSIREETAELIYARTIVAEAKILSTAEPNKLAPARLLKRLYSGAPQNAECVSVITTNYDTLIELFADLAELPIDTGFAGLRRRRLRQSPMFQTQYRRSIASGVRTTNYVHRPCLTIRLMKPHGSITWQLIDGEPIEVLNEKANAPRAIVVPGPSKYEDALVNNVFDGMRSEMNTAVGRASALLCIGFGFNDVHLQGAIRNRLDAGMPTIILTRDFTPSIILLIARYTHVVAIQQGSLGAEIHFDGQVVNISEPVWELDTFLKRFLE